MNKVFLSLSTIYFCSSLIIGMLRLSWFTNINLDALKMTNVVESRYLRGYFLDSNNTVYLQLQNFIVPMLCLFSVHFLLGVFFRKIWGVSGKRWFYLIFSFIVLSALHGFGFIWVLLLVVLQYLLFNYISTKRRLCMSLCWIVGIIFLILRETKFLQFSFISNSLSKFDDLDGVGYNWRQPLHLMMLKVVSFFYDKCYSIRGDEENERIVVVDYKKRHFQRRKEEEYNLFNFLIYCFYVPLYLSGPIITFNVFMSFLHMPSILQKDLKFLGIYVLRMLFVMIIMEFLHHTIFAHAMVIKYDDIELFKYPGIIMMISYYICFETWCHLLVIWRLARLFSILDGIGTLENINGCIHGQYSVSGFWRIWHSSYHFWLMNYVYIPLGGRNNKFRNLMIVFSFVAFWHHSVSSKNVGFIFWAVFLPILVVVENFFNTSFIDFGKKENITISKRIRICTVSSAQLFALMLTNVIAVVGTQKVFGLSQFPELVKSLSDSWMEFILPAILTYLFFFSSVWILLEIRIWQFRKKLKKD